MGTGPAGGRVARRPQRDASGRSIVAARHARASLCALASPLIVLTALAATLALPLGCALPGKLYRVAPGITGRLMGGALGDDARLRLVVLHRESKALHDRQTVVLDSQGRFVFEPTRMEIAGHEFSKVYRLYLHLERAEGDRVIWRAQMSRRALDGEIRLDCQLDRPLELGQACRVEDPLAQPWLVADGERTFQRLCASCHGSAGRPDPALQDPTLPNPPPDLRRLAERHGGRFDRDWVVRRIEGRMLSESHRGDGMPIWGERLSAEFERYAEGDELIGATLDPLVAYLASIQRPPVE